MNNYYFTFGGNHDTVEGIKLQDYWVRVVAPDWTKARAHFVEVFAKPTMGGEARWSMQYEESEFHSHYFPLGEYAVFTAN